MTNEKREELKRMIAVMQGYLDGKNVEAKPRSDNRIPWDIIIVPSWDWLDYDYRIKTEPKEIWVNEHPSFRIIYESEKAAEKEKSYSKNPSKVQTVHYREVTDE